VGARGGPGPAGDSLSILPQPGIPPGSARPARRRESPKQGRVIAPIYDDDGQWCVGFISRSVHPFCSECVRCHPASSACGRGERRWDFPPNFLKGEWLYNFAEARRSDAPFVLLVEGAPDVFRTAEAGVPAVAGFGTDLSVVQIRKLASLQKRVVIAFDNDAAGREAATSMARLLQWEGVKAVVHHPPVGFKDVGEMPAPAMAGWLAGVAPGLPQTLTQGG
jgi:hypothetical protein